MGRKSLKKESKHPAGTKPAATVAEKPFSVKFPLMWLSLSALIVYFPTISYKLTDFDDGIFINTFSEYNENVSNLFTSFQRGLFDAVKDTYYRPIFFDTMILNYQLSDHGHNLAIYHVINILFHIISVLLLYRLFIKLDVKPLHAFILTLVFAVHPVLSMAVAWIPGRNDTMLAICFLSFLIFSIDYAQKGKIRSLLLSALFLMLAFFTKETAVAAVPVAFILIVFVLKEHWLSRRNVVLYCLWGACTAAWLIVRSRATIKTDYLVPSQMLHDFLHKLPLIIQYLGKVFLPFNLSVYPMINDTVYYYGIAAAILLTVAVFLYKQRNLRVVLSGLGIFLLMLVPVLIVPDFLNLQAFEHRLYLPVIGILLILPQTRLFHSKLPDKALLAGGIGVAVIFSAINFMHQQSFSDPLSFWSQAVRTTPHSAYANMMLAARIGDPVQSDSLFLRAYSLNPNERLLNFIYGVRLQDHDSVAASEKYFLAEKKNSGYYACDLYLSRVAMERKDLRTAITYLESFLKKEPKHPIANNNLLFLYIDTEQPDKAHEQVKKMQQAGIEVPKEALRELRLPDNFSLTR